MGVLGNLPGQDQSEIARERLLHVSGRDGMSLLRECRLEFLFFVHVYTRRDFQKKLAGHGSIIKVLLLLPIGTACLQP